MRTLLLRLVPAGAALSLALVLGACSLTSSSPTPDLVIRTGTSFGFCVGYCATELYLDSNTAELAVVSLRDTSAYPVKRYSEPMSREQWERLVALADLEAMNALEDVYGCPDCADGGAEWVEVERRGQRKRVTFEYNHTVEPIEDLIKEVRAIREQLAEKVETGT